MRILICEPGKHPRKADVPHELKSLQDIVGGTLQAIYPWNEPVALVCDDEGLLKNYPFNRMIGSCNAIMGTFFICGISDEDFSDLSDELMVRFEKELYYPQTLLKTPLGYIILPLDEQRS